MLPTGWRTWGSKFAKLLSILVYTTCSRLHRTPVLSLLLGKVLGRSACTRTLQPFSRAVFGPLQSGFLLQYTAALRIQWSVLRHFLTGLISSVTPNLEVTLNSSPFHSACIYLQPISASPSKRAQNLTKGWSLLTGMTTGDVSVLSLWLLLGSEYLCTPKTRMLKSAPPRQFYCEVGVVRRWLGLKAEPHECKPHECKSESDPTGIPVPSAMWSQWWEDTEVLYPCNKSLLPIKAFASHSSPYQPHTPQLSAWLRHSPCSALFTALLLKLVGSSCHHLLLPPLFPHNIYHRGTYFIFTGLCVYVLQSVPRILGPLSRKLILLLLFPQCLELRSHRGNICG